MEGEKIEETGNRGLGMKAGGKVKGHGNRD